MSKNPQKDFVDFVTLHPEYYTVAQAPIYVKIIDLIQKQAYTMLSLKQRLSMIEPQDVELIVQTLIELKLVEELRTDERVMYYATPIARTFLAKFKRAKKKLKLA